MGTHLEIAIFLVALLANTLLGLLVFLRNPKSATARLFFLLIAIMSAWGFLNLLSSYSSHNLYYARLVLCFAVLFASVSFVFAYTFPNKKFPLHGKKLWLILGSTAVVMGLTLSPFVFKTIKAAGGGVGEPVIGPAIGLFALTVAFYDGGSLVILARKVHLSRQSERKQAVDLFVGFTLMKLTIYVLNFIFPTILKNTQFIPYASVFLFPFVVLTSYSILKHRLLDIKTIVIRSVAYVLVLLTLALLYGVVIFGITSLFFKRTDISIGLQILYMALALLLAFTFQPLKKFFDKVTRRIFFRDAYDTEDVLNEISAMFASQIKIGPLTEKTLQILCQRLKLTHGLFIVLDRGSTYWTATYNHSSNDDLTAPQLANLVRKRILITDDLDESRTKEMLTKHDIGVVAQIGDTRETVGYILLGSKQAGSTYALQDVQLLNVVSHELIVAIQNARYVQKISEFNLTLQNKVTEATRKLAATNQKLRSLDETKDDFISMASHQFHAAHVREGLCQHGS